MTAYTANIGESANSADQRWQIVVGPSAAGWGSSSAYTVQSFAGDGYVEAKIKTISGYGFIALSSTNPDSSFANLEFALYTYHAANQLFIYERSGSQFVVATSYAVNDTIRIQRTGTTIRYYKNGVLIYTSLLSSTGSLILDTAFNFDDGGGFNDAVLVDGSTVMSLSWQTTNARVTTPITESVGASAGLRASLGEVVALAESVSHRVDLLTNVAEEVALSEQIGVSVGPITYRRVRREVVTAERAIGWRARRHMSAQHEIRRRRGLTGSEFFRLITPILPINQSIDGATFELTVDGLGSLTGEITNVTEKIFAFAVTNALVYNGAVGTYSYTIVMTIGGLTYELLTSTWTILA